MEGDCQCDHGPRYVRLPDFFIDKYPVTNEQFALFLCESGYNPADSANFLKHWPCGYGLPLGETLDRLGEILKQPVVWVSHDDAKAYADWYGCRLPAEEEWQYCAGGRQKQKWPWGREYRANCCNESGGRLKDVDAYPRGESPSGCIDMCGNAWEWTDRIIDDGMHKFALLKGGSCYEAPHFWHPEGGPQPNYTHHKMPLLNEALNRSTMIGFRCVKDPDEPVLSIPDETPANFVSPFSVVTDNGLKIRFDDCEFDLAEFESEGVSLGVPAFENFARFNDGSQQLDSYAFKLPDAGFPVEGVLTVLYGEYEETEISLNMKADWPEGCPRRVDLHSPFIANLDKLVSGSCEIRLPGCSFPCPDGSDMIEGRCCFALPFLAADSSGHGIAVFFEQYDRATRLWDQSANARLNDITTVEEWKNHSVPIRLGDSSAGVLSFKILGVDDGWAGAFRLFCEKERERIDLRLYGQPEQGWYKDTVLQCFAYAYSRECFDYDSNMFDIGKLLSQGSQFGGYDAVILWHQYPRLGVDERSQWDFFEDFPGGLNGIRGIADELRQKGVRLLLPYKPWDSKFGDDDAARLAALVSQTGVDGIFLDTMDNVPAEMRQAVYAVKPSVVFSTEDTPWSRKAIQNITCSWEQYFDVQAMPGCGLLRYLLPGHKNHLINRWSIGIQKDDLCKRAVFNGMGLVIWQDIFGVSLPFSSQQKLIISKWKGIYKKYAYIFQCENPVPAYGTLLPSLYANLFISGHEVILTVYNASDTDITGGLAKLPTGFEAASLTELWYGREMKNIDRDIYGTIRSGEVILIYAER